MALARPRWFYVLEEETKRIMKARGIDYWRATVEEVASCHAEAEGRLGETLARLVREERLR